MLYLRPTSRVPPATAVKPIGSNEPVQEQNLAPNKPADAPFLVAPHVERRKHRDRRNASKNTLLETRASKDRRKTTKPSISITI